MKDSTSKPVTETNSQQQLPGISSPPVPQDDRYHYLMSLPTKTFAAHPQKRDDEAIVSQEVVGEYVVYDLFRHKAHSLNNTAAFVWQRCDGATSPNEIASQLAEEFGESSEAAENIVFLALDQLEKQHLMVHKVQRAAKHRGLSRRRIIGLVASTAAPVVVTLLTPSPAAAMSGGCTSDADCPPDQECLMGMCFDIPG